MATGTVSFPSTNAGDVRQSLNGPIHKHYLLAVTQIKNDYVSKDV